MRISKIKILLLLTMICSCKKDNFKEEYYSDGTLRYRFQVNNKGVIDGTFEEYYSDKSNELLKSRTKYINGNANDTVFVFYKNGQIKEKGSVKLGLKSGWWNYYNSNGQLKNKDEYIVLKDSIYKNQSIYFDKEGNIDYELSSFFKIDITDTLKLGWNAGKLDYYSNFKGDKKILDIIIENEYKNIGVRMDTFGIDDKNRYFGIFVNTLGSKRIKGELLETLFFKERVSKDSFKLKIKTHKKYFEKDFFTQDTLKW